MTNFKQFQVIRARFNPKNGRHIDQMAFTQRDVGSFVGWVPECDDDGHT